MLLFLTLLFWSFSALTCALLLNSELAGGKADMGQEVGKQYLTAAFPAVSRSYGTDVRQSSTDVSVNESIIIKGMIANGEQQGDATNIETEMPESGDTLDSASSGDPLVLIYHTHATESYQPVSIGNFHSVDEKGTVREVGSALKGALEARGISVMHDKTLHDHPSYSKSYSRSLDTVEKILSENPSICIVIDLHRDAAAYTGNRKHVFTVDGKTAAQFALVVGEGNNNLDALINFANKITQKANHLYPGFSRGIIRKEYKYNQHVADNYILLEMGNNENHIDEVKLSAMLFARVLEEVLKEM
jgi:stage II sporulation protein P